MRRNFPRPKNGVYYTEDNIPVQTVYISGLDADVDEKRLIDYFSKFGKINSHRIHRNRTEKFAFAFLTFETAAIAASVIVQRKHQFISRNTKAHIADSWHQPKKSESIAVDNETKSNSPPSSADPSDPCVTIDPTTDQTAIADPSALSLQMLNDDCLLCICEYLNILDIIRLSEVSTRLKLFVETNIYRKYSKLDLDIVRMSAPDQKLSLHHLRSIFMNLSEYIHIFHTTCWNIVPKHDRVLSFIHKFCMNLTEMHLADMQISDSKMLQRMSATGFPKLKVLTLKKCRGLDDKFLRLVPTLVELRIDGLRQFTGIGLHNLHGLEKLSIKYCNTLNLDQLLTYFASNTQLKRLTLKGCTRQLSTRTRFTAIIGNLKSLEYLCTDYLQGWPLDKLDNLKSLNAINSLDPCVPSLRSLAEKDQLEELDLSWCLKFADREDDFHRYLLSFSHLKVLKLNYTDNIDEQLLLKMAEKLKLTYLGCASVELTEAAVVQLVELSDCLELFYCTGATVAAVEKIIDLLNRQLYRPKLSFVVDVDVDNLVINPNRIQFLDLLPEVEDGHEDCDEELDFYETDDFLLAEFDYFPGDDCFDYDSDGTDYEYEDYEDYEDFEEFVFQDFF